MGEGLSMGGEKKGRCGGNGGGEEKVGKGTARGGGGEGRSEGKGKVGRDHHGQ